MYWFLAKALSRSRGYIGILHRKTGLYMVEYSLPFVAVVTVDFGALVSKLSMVSSERFAFIPFIAMQGRLVMYHWGVILYTSTVDVINILSDFLSK